MGNGCTSGHGVCGLPRFSKRSFAATLTFMASGVAMSTFRYNFPFFYDGSSFGNEYQSIFNWAVIVAFILMTLAYVAFMITNGTSEYFKCFLFGMIFGLGLLISGMCRISKIYGFLTLSSNWDPTLMFVMLVAVAINVFTFN
jgi:uncharacterized membrane protein YedE/YeeE